jgi:DNA invertase Pin-like site-specific DNA recombinase
MVIVAVPYLRVSTDDKGQNPQRQMEIITPWAGRECVALLAPDVDEGASATKTNPFERPKFVASCERAVSLGAQAIVVETADRFTRQGSKEDGWAEVELRKRYGLRLLRADKPLDQHGTLVGDTVDAFKAEVAREWAREHAKKVRSGMVRAKKDGKHVGRPPKLLTRKEMLLVQAMHDEGYGWRKIALAISRDRGAFSVADPKRRTELTVSHSHIKRTYEAHVAGSVANCES